MANPFPPVSDDTQMLAVRMPSVGVEWLWEHAEQMSVTRSEVIKAALAYMADHPSLLATRIAQRQKT